MRSRLVRIFLLAPALLLLAADNPFIGKWEWNATKSKMDSSYTAKKQTIEYSMDGPNVKASIVQDGRPTEPTMYDGKEYEANTGSPLGYSHRTARQNGRTLETSFKRNGKIVGTRKNTLSSDGRTMTVIYEGTKPDGSRLYSVGIFDKQ